MACVIPWEAIGIPSEMFLVRRCVVCGVWCVQVRANINKVAKDFNLSNKFVDMSYAVFKQLDLDGNGAIDQQ